MLLQPWARMQGPPLSKSPPELNAAPKSPGLMAKPEAEARKAAAKGSRPGRLASVDRFTQVFRRPRRPAERSASHSCQQSRQYATEGFEGSRSRRSVPPQCMHSQLLVPTEAPASESFSSESLSVTDVAAMSLTRPDVPASEYPRQDCQGNEASQESCSRSRKAPRSAHWCNEKAPLQAAMGASMPAAVVAAAAVATSGVGPSTLSKKEDIWRDGLGPPGALTAAQASEDVAAGGRLEGPGWRPRPTKSASQRGVSSA